MSDSETPQPPASLLAGVLAILRPGKSIQSAVRRVRIGSLTSFGMFYEASYDPNSKDDLARVVAMLDGAQTMLFDHHMNIALESARTHMDSQRPNPAEVLKADPKTILAAIVAATGVRA